MRSMIEKKRKTGLRKGEVVLDLSWNRLEYLTTESMSKHQHGPNLNPNETFLFFHRFLAAQDERRST